MGGEDEGMGAETIIELEDVGGFVGKWGFFCYVGGGFE